MSIRKVTWTTKDGKEHSSFVLFYLAGRKENGKPNRIQETFATKAEAKDREAEIAREKKLGTHTPISQSKTITEVWDLWLDHCAAEGIERGTLEQRRQHLTLHVADFIGQRKLAELSGPGVNDYLDALREAGRSASMRQKVLINLRIVLKFAMARGYVTQNVASAATVKRDSGRDE